MKNDRRNPIRAALNRSKKRLTPTLPAYGLRTWRLGVWRAADELPDLKTSSRLAGWAKIRRLKQEARGSANYGCKSAQIKDQDKMLDAGDAVSTACSNCHNRYGEAARRAGFAGNGSRPALRACDILHELL
jgi:hypothetical protein